MKVLKIGSPDGYANTYVLTADGKNAVVIDPSGEEIAAALQREGLTCGYVLLTHGHFDHVGGCAALQRGGAAICCGEHEKDFIFSRENLSIFGGVYIPPFKVERTFSDGEKFVLSGIEFTAIAAPGHSAGSMCYIAENNLFSGDALFRLSVGRTDLPTGDARIYGATLRKLAALGGNYRVYPGHGEDTDLAFERAHNPFLIDLC